MKDLIIALEKSLHKKQNRTNKSFLGNILHPDFKEITSFGELWDKNKTIEQLLAEKDMAISIKSSKYEVSLLSPIMYQVIYETIINYQGQVYNSVRTSIWIKNNKMQLIFHQATKVL